jgi:transposase-like protein
MKAKTGKTDGRGRRLRNAEDRQKLVGQYKQSGLSKTEFCRQHGLELSTFCGWFSAKRMHRVKRRGRKPKFAQMQVALGKTAAIEIELPSRICIRLQDAGVVGDLVKFVREVGAC